VVVAAPAVAGLAKGNNMAEAIEAPRSAHWGVWGTLIWGTVIPVIGGLLQIIGLFTVVLWRDGDIENLSGSELAQVLISTSDSGLGISVMAFLTTVVGGGLVVGVIKLKKDSVLHEYLCIKPVSLATMRNWLGLLGGLLIIEELLAIALGHSGSEFLSVAYATANPVWVLWIALVIAAPLFEETLFRGFLLKGFTLSFMGPIGAVVVTSGVWAALHVQYDAFDMATVFCSGLLFGTARLVTGSLLVPLALHAATNLLATAVVAILS
jgi:membrane protease YdiL (CAAX protease family)